ncbi:solute carrier family 22 member 13-like [Sinocyclocheilus rhinocerous]|uniref:solute carrier family 22 member 13-like n=1 Tax=Sinocyclocheilus rhinocerous TaxID=307959 RepID=UPI0007B917FB|nr:PREDICTED: solute carrier family 22 member 13-like [Sinocyclocheilus rhinocerous]
MPVDWDLSAIREYGLNETTTCTDGWFIVGVALGGFRINSIILATEWIGVAQRSYAACLSQVLAALGQSLPDGFLSAEELQMRKNSFKKAAAINKRTVPDSLVEKVLNEKPVERGGIKIFFASHVLRKYFLTITFVWCVLNLAYYSLSLNVGKFGLDIFLNQLIFGLSEIPVHFLCVWSLETAGRKVSLMGALIVGGSLCLLTLVVPQSNYIAIAALATCGRFLMNGAGSVCNVYIQELFYTSIRQTATGLGSTAARAASMLSLVVNLLEIYHFTIPTLVFGCLALASGIMAFLLPETRCTELPGSTEEAEGKRENNTLSLFPKRRPKMTNPAPGDCEDIKATKL